MLFWIASYPKTDVRMAGLDEGNQIGRVGKSPFGVARMPLALSEDHREEP